MEDVNPRRWRWLVVNIALVAGTVVPSLGTAQTPEVRSLERSEADGGPLILDTALLAPLFLEGAPAEAAVMIADEDFRDCRSALAPWIDENGDHPHILEARFMLGYCAHESGEHEQALSVLSEVSEGLPVIADHANYFAAVSAFDLESYETVVALSLGIPIESVYGPRSTYLRGRALRRADRSLEATGVLQGFVDRYPGAWYIERAELELGQAYEEVGELENAASLYRRVASRYPGSSLEDDAEELLEDILPRLSEDGRDRYAQSSHEDVVARATALFGRHRSEQVIDLLGDLLEDLTAGESLFCQSNYLIGKSYSKLRQHSDALPFYVEVVESGCTDVDLIVKSLYNAGRSLWNIDRDQEAIEMFRRLHTGYSGHTYADDAMLYEARIERSNGNEDTAQRILEEQIQRFPEGDMLSDANWLLFESSFSGGDLEAAIAFADAIASRTGENSLYNRGRIAYFRARALELSGRSEQATDAFSRVAQDTPLSFYALLALNRLLEIAPDAGQDLLGQLRDGATLSNDGGLIVEPSQVADEPAFARGLLLLRMGLLDLSEAQFDQLTDAYPNQDSVLWLVTFLFDHVGAYHISHNIPRRSIESFLASYPTAETGDYWRMAYPTPFFDEIEEAADERDLDTFLIYAIMREESGFNPRAESWANARGLMQLMVPTAESMADRTGRGSLSSRDLFRPEVAIELGSEYLRVLSNRYDSHPVLTIAGYNGGEGNVDRWVRENGHLPLDQFVEEIPYRQTRDYAKRVTMTYWIYHWLYVEDEPLLHLPFTVQEPS